MLADLDPLEDVFIWAKEHNVRVGGGRGFEPVFQAGQVLELAQS
jgi:hypothetical protein